MRESTGVSPTATTRRRPPRLPQLAFWLSTSHQGSSSWVGPEIVSTSPMEPTLGTPWERKVWKDHSLFGLPYLNPDVDLSRRWGEPPDSHLGCWSGVRPSPRFPTHSGETGPTSFSSKTLWSFSHLPPGNRGEGSRVAQRDFSTDGCLSWVASVVRGVGVKTQV